MIPHPAPPTTPPPASVSGAVAGEPTPPYVAVAGAGGQFSLARPRVADVGISWLATSLARQPRWNGHTRTDLAPYTVAEHLIWCAERAWNNGDGAEVALAVLLHDAHEAVVGDIPTPVKAWLGERGLDRRRLDAALLAIDQAIYAAFGLAYPLTGMAKRAVAHWDAAALVTEWRDLVADPKPPLMDAAALARMPAPYPHRIEPWDGDKAEVAGWFTGAARFYAHEAGLDAPALDI